tara:strand:+ start:137 stop:442 length:306 start_codon:yes stop_codon:yes gene_type:complete
VQTIIVVDEATVALEASPGDVVMFTSYTVHGSKPNTTDQPRRSYINGYVRASACDVGKWAFLDGKAVPVTSDRDYHRIRSKEDHEIHEKTRKGNGVSTGSG